MSAAPGPVEVAVKEVAPAWVLSCLSSAYGVLCLRVCSASCAVSVSTLALAIGFELTVLEVEVFVTPETLRELSLGRDLSNQS